MKQQISHSPVVAVQQAGILQGDKEVLSNVSFEIDKGEFVYLIGRTGSGKSSLLKTLYADLPLTKGKATVAGFAMPNPSKSYIPFLRRKIGVIFQDFQLLFDRSVYENLLFVLKATGWKDNAKIKNRISEVLMQVGMEFSMHKLPHQLSGGEQQRIAIARALLNEPLILLADEPTGNLDPEVAEEIMKLFWKINHNGTSVLLATHNLAFLTQFPAPVLKCENGKLTDSRQAKA